MMWWLHQKFHLTLTSGRLWWFEYRWICINKFFFASKLKTGVCFLSKSKESDRKSGTISKLPYPGLDIVGRFSNFNIYFGFFVQDHSNDIQMFRALGSKIESGVYYIMNVLAIASDIGLTYFRMVPVIILNSLLFYCKYTQLILSWMKPSTYNIF